MGGLDPPIQFFRCRWAPKSFATFYLGSRCLDAGPWADRLRRVVTTRHTLILSVVFAAALAVSVSAPAKTAPEIQVAWTDNFQAEPVQSAEVHALVGASFHAIHASF